MTVSISPSHEFEREKDVELPSWLDGLRAKTCDVQSVSRLVERAVNGISSTLDSLDHRGKITAHLDLSMMQSALEKHEIGIPPPLRLLVERLALELRLPPQLTYQLYFLENPSQEPRTFFPGEIGASEVLLQGAHGEMETQHLKPAVDHLIRLAKGVDSEQDRLGFFISATHHIDRAKELLLALISRLPPQHFKEFVSYLHGTGARYSAAFPAIDTLLLSYLPTYPVEEKEHDLLVQPLLGATYATSADLEIAKQLRKDMPSPFISVLQGASNIKELHATLMLLESYRSLRSAHLSAVKQFVSPDASRVSPGDLGLIRRRQTIKGVISNAPLQAFGRTGTGGVSNIPVYLSDFIARIDDSIAFVEQRIADQD